ncbi:MAG: hypothetical protein PHF46_04660 [Candidatus Gracilibacteria bacterium]|nr:hypothetical protein [Candidatus Gracilibacteria bacterium]
MQKTKKQLGVKLSPVAKSINTKVVPIAKLIQIQKSANSSIISSQNYSNSSSSPTERVAFVKSKKSDPKNMPNSGPRKSVIIIRINKRMSSYLVTRKEVVTWQSTAATIADLDCRSFSTKNFAMTNTFVP